MRHLVLSATLVAVCAAAAAAQPRVANGQLQPVQAGGRFTRAALDALASSAAAPAWVGYAVPAIDGDHRMCCWNGDGGGFFQSCRLEGGSAAIGSVTSSSAPSVVALESGRTLHVLFRIEGGRIDRLRTFSDDCALDAGGLTVRWLTDVSGADSVATLASFLAAGVANRLADGALTALAMHRDPAALDRLLAAARTGDTVHVRGQALFWLAQRAGDKAVGAITEAIARDPETQVKTRAVFALSQLPRDEGVPLLIQVARTHANPAVKKQAMFWLGQSKDARALKFFEEVLFK